MEKQPLLILGTGLFALETFDLVSDMPGFEAVGFVENQDRSRCGEPIEGLPVHWVGDIKSMAGTHKAFCAIGSTRRQAYIEEVERLGFSFAALVHPTARVSRRSELGPGTLVSAGTLVAAYTRIGRHVILNRGVTVGHHTEIGDYVTISPAANVAGACRIGSGVYIAMAATVIDYRTVGEGTVVGAGAVVTKDLPAHVLALGVPAQVVKENIERK